MGSSNEVTNPLPTRLAILLLVIGLLFALDTFLQLSVVYKFWPALVAMTGVGLIGIFLKGNARAPMFLAAGVYLVCFSGLALYRNSLRDSRGRLLPDRADDQCRPSQVDGGAASHGPSQC